MVHHDDPLTGFLSMLQVDNAQTLCSMGGLHLILQGLNSSDVRVQENSAFVLGSALARCVLVDVSVALPGETCNSSSCQQCRS